MRDPIVGRALGLLHSEIARRWTTEDLAREIAVSRSAFAERFTRVIGEPPMRYLARQRFEQASARFKGTRRPDRPDRLRSGLRIRSSVQQGVQTQVWRSTGELASGAHGWQSLNLIGSS